MQKEVGIISERNGVLCRMLEANPGETWNVTNLSGAGGNADTLCTGKIECVPQQVYRHRQDGKSGREIIVRLKGTKLFGASFVTVKCEGKTETTPVPTKDTGVDSLTVLLPEGASVSLECVANITLRSGNCELTSSVKVPAIRQWTVFLYPHSHVDIGYTQTQEIVEKITVRNLKTGMELARESRKYPEGARYVWNPETIWAWENFLKQATPEQKDVCIAAARAGQIGIDANYAHLNTSICSDEELLRFFEGGLKLRKMTGTLVNTMVQMDVPGASWGLPQAAAQCGIKGIIDFPNGSYHIGDIRRLCQRPFYWVAPDGKHRILYLQGPQYDLGWMWKGSRSKPSTYPHYENPVPGWVQDYPAVIDRIRTDNPSENFIPLSYILQETAAIEHEGLPYDYLTMTWSMSDNSIIDADLPDAVKGWNEKYAYPKLVIASANTIISAYERKFGNLIPERHGDLTEYWTDGLGSDALRVGYNRLSRERLTQAEIVWTMLNGTSGTLAPVDAIYDSWRWVMLGSEHTWGYHDPTHPLASVIEATKASYFENGDKTSRAVLTGIHQPVTSASSQTISVLNALSWPRNGLVTLTAEQSIDAQSVTDDSGNQLISQRLNSGEFTFLATDIPALGSKTFHLANSPVVASTTHMASCNDLENALIKVKIDHQTGDISSLVDKRSGHDFVNIRSPCAINAYRYLLGADSAFKASAPKEVTVSIRENGPLVASLLVESKAAGCRSLTREVRIIAGQPQVEILNLIDKIATRTKEGVHFGFAFNIPNGTIRMDIPWGVMIPRTDQIPGSNHNWLAFQRWVDVANSQYGVTWLSIEVPIIEIGNITANQIDGVKGNPWLKTISPDQTIFSWVLNNHWNTNFPLEQGGIIPFHYAILPHYAYDPAVANRFALEQNRPLIAVSATGNLIGKPLVAFDNPRIFISTFKPAEHGKGTILRLRSLSDKGETVRLSFPAGAPKSVKVSDPTEVAGAKIGKTISFLPYGVITLRIEFHLNNEI